MAGTATVDQHPAAHSAIDGRRLRTAGRRARRHGRAGIARALRHDYIIVPLMRGADGDRRPGSSRRTDPDGERAWELCLFSSTKAFADFVAGDPQREFAIRTGSSLAPSSRQYQDLLRRVVFDPAGPHPVQASVEDVLAALAAGPRRRRPVAWITAPETGCPRIRPPPGERVSGSTWRWTTTGRSSTSRTERWPRRTCAALVKRQLRGHPAGAGAAWTADVVADVDGARRGRRAAASWPTSPAGPRMPRRRSASRSTGTSSARARRAPPGRRDRPPARRSLGGDDLVARRDARGSVRAPHYRTDMGPAELGGRPSSSSTTGWSSPDRRGLACSASRRRTGMRSRRSACSPTTSSLAASWELAPAMQAAHRLTCAYAPARRRSPAHHPQAHRSAR